MNVIFFDGQEWENLQPLTLTKPVGELRMGILTLKERWEKLLKSEISYLTEKYLSDKFPVHSEETNLFLNPAYFPDADFLNLISSLKKGESLWDNENLI